MLRIAQRTVGRIRIELADAAGEPLPADTPVAVELTRGPDPIEAVASGDAEPLTGEPSGVFEFAVPRAVTDTLGPVRAVWTYAADGDEQVAETWHEVVSAHLVTVRALRRLEPLDTVADYPTWLVELGRDIATYALEDACSQAFARKRATGAYHSPGKYVALGAHDAEVIAATYDGSAVSDDVLADYFVGPGGLLSFGYNMHRHGMLGVTYEHGFHVAPPRVARAAALLTREWLQENRDETIPQRATTLDSDAGNIRLVTAGEFGRGFDLPEVNAVVQTYKA